MRSLEESLTLLLQDVKLANDAFFLKGKFYRIDFDVEIEHFKTQLYRYYTRRRKKDIPESYEPIINLKEYYVLLLKELYTTDVDKNWLVADIVFQDLPVLRKGYTDRVIEKGIFIQNRPYTPPIKKGDLIDIPFPITKIDKRWFWIYGRIFPVENNDDVIRFYFNFKTLKRLDIIDSFILYVVNELNQRNISFKLKLPSEISGQNGFFRADAVVIYIEKLSYFLISNLIHTIHEQFEAFLEDDTPLFTLKIGKGLAMAEEPKDFHNRSFGENNIHTIIELIRNIAQNQTLSSAQLVKLVVDSQNLRDIINIETPHLLKKSFIPAKFPAFLDSDKLPKLTVQEIYLKYAIQIGYQLCNSAIFSFADTTAEQTCSWLAVRLKISEEALKVKRVNSDFYKGSIGICWFLWKLYEFYPDYPFYFTAIAGIRNICRNKQPSALGFFEGKLGLLYLLNDVLASKSVIEDSIKTEIENYKKALLDDINKSFDTIEGSRFGDIMLGINKVKKGLDETKVLAMINNHDFNKVGKFPESISQVFSYGNLFNRSKMMPIYDKILPIIEAQHEEFKKNNSAKIKSEASYFQELLGLALSRIQINKKIDIILPTFYPNSTYLKEKLYYIEMIDCLEKLTPVILSYDVDKDNSLIRSIWGVIDLMLTTEQMSDDTFRQIPKKLDLNLFFDKIIEKYLSNNLLPPFEFGHDFYNPGITDGLAGLGYIFLRKQFPTKVKSLFFND